MSEKEWKKFIKERDDIKIIQELSTGKQTLHSLPSKMGNKKTVVDGFAFDSVMEAKRWIILKRWEAAHLLTDLSCQHQNKVDHTWILQEKYRDKVGKLHRAIRYIDDFQYRIDGVLIIEDIKGFETENFRKNEKLFCYKFPELNFFVNHDLNGWFK